MGAIEESKPDRSSVLLAVFLGVAPVVLPLTLSYFIDPAILMSLALPITGAMVAAAIVLYVSRVVLPRLRQSALIAIL